MPPRAVVVGWREREAPPPTQLQICEGDAAPFSRPPETSLLPDSFRPKPTCPTIGGATLVTVLSGSHKDVRQGYEDEDVDHAIALSLSEEDQKGKAIGKYSHCYSNPAIHLYLESCLLLIGSILAHEMMHAWLRLKGMRYLLVHPLPGGTVDWGCFRLVTTWNRLVTVDFDHRQLLSGGNDRFRLSSVDFGWYQPREKEEEGEPRDPACSPNLVPSLAGFLALRGKNLRLSREEEND
ncbi:hypothetical protein GW17_00048317, partial [Ensete ventricosum]